MDPIKLIKSLTEEEWFLIFIVALDGVATLSAMVDRGIYEGIVYGEANPLFLWAMQQGMVMASLLGAGCICLYILMFRKTTGALRDTIWYSAVLSHSFGALTWLMPYEMNNYLWGVFGYSWTILNICLILSGAALSQLFTNELRKTVF